MTCKEIYPLPTIIVGVRDELHIIEHRTLGRDKIEVISLKNMDISALAYNSNNSEYFNPLQGLCSSRRNPLRVFTSAQLLLCCWEGGRG